MVVLRSGPQKKAFEKWGTCIRAGRVVELEVVDIDGDPAHQEKGYCDVHEERVDLVLKCLYCVAPDFKTEREKPYHERTAIRRARIGKAARRTRERRKEVEVLQRDHQTRFITEEQAKRYPEKNALRRKDLK